MRISDGSSDVCASDLIGRERRKIFVEIIGTIIRVILLDEVAHFGFDRRRIGLCGFRRSRRGGVVRATRSEKKGTGDQESVRSEEHTSELQSLMRISYAVFCLKKQKHKAVT